MPKIKLYYRHWHMGNDPQHSVRRHAEFATQCKAINLDTGEIVAETWAFASPKDSPTRAKGREISGGRMLKLLKTKGIQESSLTT
jgi:hypothetical protein